MHILISNDDGYQAPGLAALAEALSAVAEITVVAPDRNRSGASHSLTLQRPLRVQQATNGFYFVDGTPTDCVHLALTGLMDKEPDIVVSGINSGANLGDDVLYSGTVAAATEGRFLGLPALAVSLNGHENRHFETAAQVSVQLVRHLLELPLQEHTLLNVNVPDIPYADLQGMQATRLGFRHKSQPVVCAEDPYKRPVYWVGGSGPVRDAGEGTDFNAIESHRVSITPLQIDLTRHQGLPSLNTWLQQHPAQTVSAQ